jgi:hypothetical protein
MALRRAKKILLDLAAVVKVEEATVVAQTVVAVATVKISTVKLEYFTSKIMEQCSQRKMARNESSRRKTGAGS